MLRSRPALGAVGASSRGLRQAVSRLGSVAILLLTLLAFWWMRGPVSISAQITLTLAACAGLALALRRYPSVGLLVAYLLGFGLFAVVRARSDDVGIATHYAYVANIETWVFHGVPSHWLQAHFYHPDRANFINVVSFGTYTSYFFVVHIVAFAIWFKRRERFLLYGLAAMLTFYLGVLVSLVLPTAPPWLAAQHGYIPQTVLARQELLTHLFGSQDTSQVATMDAGGNDVAAMPSLHMAITVIVAIAAWRFDWRAGVLGVLYCALMAVSLVYLGEHYFTDCAAGALTAGLAWRTSSWLTTRWSARTSRPITFVGSRPDPQVVERVA